MTARARILARIRAQQGRGASRPSRAELEAMQTYVGRHPRGFMPPVEGDLVARFSSFAEALASTVVRVPGWNAVPRAAAQYLSDLNLPRSGCVWPRLAHLDWKGAGLDLQSRRAEGDDLVGVTGCYCALAETGTLMLLSGPDTPAATSLLPETHIAVLEAKRIVAHMEDAWDLLRAEYGQPPRAVNFISGPSRTADIEQTVVMGAHGPYRVHIIIVEAD